MPDLETRVSMLAEDAARARAEAALALREGATAMAAASLIHDNVIALSRRVGEGFHEMRESFAAIGSQLGDLSGHLAGTDQRLHGVETRLGAHEDRLGRIEDLLGQILERLPAAGQG